MELTKRLSLTHETANALASTKHLTGATDGQLAQAIGVSERDLLDAAQKRASMGTTQTVARKLAEQLRAQNGKELAQKKRPAQKSKTIKEGSTDGRGRNKFTGVKRKKSNPYQSLGQDSGEADGRAERRGDGTRKKPRFTESF